jgi:hypothetical protein
VAELRDALAYICGRYCDGLSLSVSRLTKILYLADWRSCITRGQQATPIQWKLNDSGPFCTELQALLRFDRAFEVVTTRSILKGKSERVVLVSDFGWKSLSREDREVLDFVLKTSREKYLSEFQRLIDSTYPVYKGARSGDSLDLAALAFEYGRRQPTLVLTA